MSVNKVGETVVEEWDGELNHVVYWEVDGDVIIQYDDGLTHCVKRPYFDSIRRDALLICS